MSAVTHLDESEAELDEVTEDEVHECVRTHRHHNLCQSDALRRERVCETIHTSATYARLCAPTPPIIYTYHEEGVAEQVLSEEVLHHEARQDMQESQRHDECDDVVTLEVGW